MAAPDQTTTDGERGLLGIAFSPDGEHLYLSYTNEQGDSRLDEWATDNPRNHMLLTFTETELAKLRATR